MDLALAGQGRQCSACGALLAAHCARVLKLPGSFAQKQGTKHWWFWTSSLGKALFSSCCRAGLVQAEVWGPAARKHTIEVPESSLFAAFSRAVRPPRCGPTAQSTKDAPRLLSWVHSPGKQLEKGSQVRDPPVAAHSSSLTHRHHRSPDPRFSEQRPVYICS